ncbi:SHOCT domain-containing protein [Metallumcola ferriviriculae]|uniref:SHOCT domain-containing protein n=1 Tax=Metallumcola ferriviriculae TaxID=3039180 RepID=A0AAU0UML8_9FIRM|nr:SHOCT domain-containing protein [Desulfitibacteraceae bacterium MK1]
MMGGYGMGYGAGLLGIFYMLVPLLIIGLIIYWAVRAAVQSGGVQQKTGHMGAIEIAEERYARGEISDEELNTIRSNLKKK